MIHWLEAYDNLISYAAGALFIIAAVAGLGAWVYRRSQSWLKFFSK